MKYCALLDIVGDEPVFETGLLLAGDVDPSDVRRQLSRWVADGRVLQLRRGLYSIAPPYQKVKPHPFLIANRLVRGSYVSLQAALAHHGLIPENVPIVTSVTVGRPGLWETSLGIFSYRHIQSSLFQGFHREDVQNGQRADVATPAKALIDLIYLEKKADDPRYLQELRLKLEDIDMSMLVPLKDLNRPKLLRALKHLSSLVANAHAAETEIIQ